MRRYVRMALACLASGLGAMSTANTQAADLPHGGAVKLGHVSGAVHGGTALVLNQTSQAAVIEWQSFGIAENHTVVVQQPFRDSVLLNRVMGDEISVIAGTLRAPGSILLVNPNGVHITATGRVATGGFLASSMHIDNDDVYLGNAELHKKVNSSMHSTKIARMGATSARGGVCNAGLIQVADGGYVSLTGLRAVHDGEINVRGGHVAISGPGYLHVQGRIDLDRHPAAATSPIDIDIDSATTPDSPDLISPSLNRYDAGARRAASDGASIAGWATGGAASSAASSAAGGITSPGMLRLLGSNIDIRASDTHRDASGNRRSFVHADTVAEVLRDASVIISSVGTWPSHYADTASGAAAAKPSPPLPTEPHALAQALEKAGWRPGDIQIASPLTWSTDTSLTLASTGSIRINAPVTALGNDPLVHLYPGVRHDITFAQGRLSMPGPQARFAISGKPYTLIRNAGELRHAIQQGSAQDYAVAKHLDLRGIVMSPITLPDSHRTYRINGLGNHVHGLAIDSNATTGVGLFTALHGQSTVSHLHLIDPDIRGAGETGAFVGVMRDQSRLIGVSVKGGRVRASSTASVNGSLGGIAGTMQDQSVISHTHLHDVVVRGVDNVGGIAGGMSAGAHINDVVFSGTTEGRDRVGGIVGQQRGGRVERITLKGQVNGRHDVGGVAGNVGAGSLITAVLSDAKTKGSSGAGAIAGSLAYGSRHRMLGNVTPKGEPHYGERAEETAGAAANAVTEANAVTPLSWAMPSASQSALARSPSATSFTAEKVYPAMPDAMADHIRELNPRPWNGKGCS